MTDKRSFFQIIKQILNTRVVQIFNYLLVVMLSIVSALTISCLPYRWFERWLGEYRPKASICALATLEQSAYANQLGRFIHRVCEKMPWEAKCLVQAMVFSVYARFHQIPYVIYTGMSKLDEPRDGMMWTAHAWVKVDRYVVLGGAESEISFKVLANYFYFPR